MVAAYVHICLKRDYTERFISPVRGYSCRSTAVAEMPSRTAVTISSVKSDGDRQRVSVYFCLCMYTCLTHFIQYLLDCVCMRAYPDSTNDKIGNGGVHVVGIQPRSQALHGSQRKTFGGFNAEFQLARPALAGPHAQPRKRV